MPPCRGHPMNVFRFQQSRVFDFHSSSLNMNSIKLVLIQEQQIHGCWCPSTGCFHPSFLRKCLIWFDQVQGRIRLPYQICRKCWWQTWICQWEPGNGMVGWLWWFKGRWKPFYNNMSNSFESYTVLIMFTIVWPFPAKLSCNTNRPKSLKWHSSDISTNRHFPNLKLLSLHGKKRSRYRLQYHHRFHHLVIFLIQLMNSRCSPKTPGAAALLGTCAVGGTCCAACSLENCKDPLPGNTVIHWDETVDEDE